MYGTIVLCLSKASPPALMDTCTFKSISINETESSNGASFQEGELEYTFSLQGPDCGVHSAHSALYWNERCAAWLPERVKIFWEIEDSLDGYIGFFPFIIPSLIHLLIVKGRKWERKLLMASITDNMLIISVQTVIRLNEWWWVESEMQTSLLKFVNTNLVKLETANRTHTKHLSCWFYNTSVSWVIIYSFYFNCTVYFPWHFALGIV